MTGMGASDLPHNNPLSNPTEEPKTRHIVLNARETTATINKGVDSHVDVAMATHREAPCWETWTMHLPQRKTLLVWVKKVEDKENRSSQLWIERVPKSWTRYPHAGWPME
jgi:hypothetical protein